MTSSEAIQLLSELADVIEAVKGKRDLLRVSGQIGDREDIGVIGIDRFVAMVRAIAAAPQL